MRYYLKYFLIISLFLSLLLAGCAVNKLSAPEIVGVMPDTNTIIRVSDKRMVKAIDALNYILNSNNLVSTEGAYSLSHPLTIGIYFKYNTKQKVRLRLVGGKLVTIATDNFYLADHGSYVVLIKKQDETFDAWALEKQIDFSQIYQEAKYGVQKRAN